MPNKKAKGKVRKQIHKNRRSKVILRRTVLLIILACTLLGTGIYLKEKISEEFKAKEFPHSIKYIDPSYIIRSAPANANDSKFCNLLAQNAVHAALAGKTDFVVGYWNYEFTLVPIPMAVAKRKKIDVEGELWWNVLEATGQPISMKNK